MEDSGAQSVLPKPEQQANLKMTDQSKIPGSSGSEKKPSIKLPSMSTVDTVMTKLVKEKIKDSIEEPEIDSGLPHSVKQMSRHTICLPKVWQHFAEELRKKIEDILIDSDMRDDLEGSHIINWCDSVKILNPMRIAGDGNCLLHAVSKAMWGVHDNTLLRRLVYIALVEDDKQFIRNRWLVERKKMDAKIPDGGLQLTETEWDNEWAMVVKAAEDVKRKGTSLDELPFECLEEVHIFVLANVLKRPIIVLAETVIRNLEGSALGINNFPGIYLPLLWDSKECIKTPLILGYSMNHFTPLIGTENEGDDNAAAVAQDNHAVPLVNHRLESLHVHFLLEDEEAQGHETLQKYMDITEATFQKPDAMNIILAAKLNYIKMDDTMDIVNKFFRMCEHLYTEYMEECSKQEPVKVACQTQGCKRYGKAELDFSCPRCYLQNASGSESENSNGTNDGVPITTESVHNINKNPPITPSSSTEPGTSHQQRIATSGVVSYDNYGEGLGAMALPEAGANLRRLQSPVLSMVEEQCSFPGCDNNCAVTTKPYCHVHVFLSTVPARDPTLCHYPGCHEKKKASCKPYCQTHKLPTNEDEDSNGTEASTIEIQCVHEGCQNLTSRLTYPNCHEHRQLATSMMGEFCTKIGCANFQSENTTPFCHEHDNPRLGLDSGGSSPEALDTEHRASRFDDMLPVFMAFICAIPSCDKKVSIDTDMYCREHYIEKYGELPRHSPPSSTLTEDLHLPSRRVHRSSSSSGSKTPPRNTEETNLPQSENQPRSLDTSLGLSGRSIRCQEPGCMLTGIASWNYCCSQHRVINDNNSRQISSGQDNIPPTDISSSPEETSTNRDLSSRLSRREAATESRPGRPARNDSSSPTGLRVPSYSRPDRSPSGRSDDDSTSPPSRRFGSGHRYDSTLHSRNEYSFPEISSSSRESRVPLYSSNYSNSPREYGSSRYDSGLSRYGRSTYGTRLSSPSPTRSASPKAPAPSVNENATEPTSTKENIPKPPQMLVFKPDKPMSKLDKTRELLRLGLCHKSGCKNPAENRYSGFCKSCAAHSQFLQIDDKKEKKTESKEPCKTNGCRLVGSPEFGGYCYQCQGNPQMNGHRDMDTMEILAQLPAPHNTVNAKPFQQCKNKDCLGIANEQTGGYCSKCYTKKVKPVASPTTNSKTNQSSSSAEIVTAYGGARPKENGRTKSRSLDRSESNMIGGPSLKTDKLANGGQVKINKEQFAAIPNLSNMEDATKAIKRCTGQGCNRVAYDAFNGICQLCYTKSTQKAPRNGIRETSTKEAEPVGNSDSGAQACKTDGCDMFGTDAQMGYCSTCHRKMKAKKEQGHQQDLQRNSDWVGVPVKHERSSSRVTAVAKPCKNSLCDRFGDLNLQGYCSFCFESTKASQKHTNRTNRNIQGKQFKAACSSEKHLLKNESDDHLRNTAERSYKEVVRKIETSSRTSYACCKNTGCGNMGNSRCRGYCNTCFHFSS